MNQQKQNQQKQNQQKQQWGALKGDTKNTVVTPEKINGIDKRFFTQLGRLLQQPRGDSDRTVVYMRDTWFPKYTTLKPKEDMSGNFHLQVGENPTTLFIAHHDTVDSHTLVKPKTLMVSSTMTKVFLDTKDRPMGAVLGADDGVGCALLVALAEAGVPGYYIWSNEEESGCIGIKALITTMGDEWFKRFNRCVCVDRKDTTEVITHQCGAEGCSLEFASALCDALGMNHEPSDKGVFTDSFELFHLIPECTNIAAGYYQAHTRDEWLNLQYVEALRKAMLKVDWESLPTKRTPVKAYNWGTYSGGWEDYGSTTGGSWTYSSYKKEQKYKNLQELTMLLSSYGEVAAKIVEDWGFTDELIEAIYNEIYKGHKGT